MTRKDYELIANNLLIAKPSDVLPANPADMNGGKEAYTTGRIHAWQNTCKTMGDGLRITNPLFDRARFLQACGVEAV